ncbi:hypothetical protein NX059_012021 [Plenodomus lindquistii]|nr:hypothetical protein NX059_012021 [Plenodomus lindquistii]
MDRILKIGSAEFWDMKDICSIATEYNTTHVVLCDYENLVLFELERIPETKDQYKRANITIVPKVDFRKATLGFLEAAIEANGSS